MAREPSWLRAAIPDGVPPLPDELVVQVKADLLANIPHAERPRLLDEDIQRAWRTIFWAAVRDFMVLPADRPKPAPSSFLAGVLLRWGKRWSG